MGLPPTIPEYSGGRVHVVKCMASGAYFTSAESQEGHGEHVGICGRTWSVDA